MGSAEAVIVAGEGSEEAAVGSAAGGLAAGREAAG